MSCHLKFLGARSGKLLLTLASVLALPEHVHTSLPLVTLLLRAVGEGARLYRMCARRSFPSEVAVSTLKHFALALRMWPQMGRARVLCSHGLFLALLMEGIRQRIRRASRCLL